jgi:hypothetical protein
MKNITPIQIWNNGELKTATKIDIRSIDNNLDSARFTYVLFSDNSEEVATGEKVMSGDDYINYSSNDYAYSWIASKINITLSN